MLNSLTIFAPSFYANYMHSFVEYASLFEDFINTQRFFDKTPTNLYEPCTYILAIGGKRIRPAVCLMAAEMFANKAPQDSYWAAASVELFHNFTLIHDDIMDASPLRRGQETVHQKYGLTTGILAGDVMAIYAYSCLEHIAQHNLFPIIQLFNKTSIEVCEGQQLDMDFEKMDGVNKEQYIHMIGLKTAVLLACSMKMGAITGGASAQEATLMYTFGKNLGIAFQLQDDYLDTFGDGAVVGKKIGGDIRANKKTYLAIAAEDKANPQQKQLLQDLRKDNTEDKVSKTIALFDTLQIQKECKLAIQHYTHLATEALDAIALPKDKKQAFNDLVAFLITRDY